MTKIKMELLTDNDLLLTIEKCIREGIRYSIYQHAEVNNKLW